MTLKAEETISRLGVGFTMPIAPVVEWPGVKSIVCRRGGGKGRRLVIVYDSGSERFVDEASIDEKIRVAELYFALYSTALDAVAAQHKRLLDVIPFAQKFIDQYGPKPE